MVQLFNCNYNKNSWSRKI